MKTRKKNKMLLTCIVMAVLILLGQLVYAEVKEKDVERDLAMASDLAQISGLTDVTVLKIYEAIYDWDTVSENIFVYRKILSYADIESEEYEKTIEYFGEYDPDDLLTIYEYLDENGKSKDRIEKILKQYDKGEELSNILSYDLGEGDYTIYQPASKDDIRKWLSEGYLPQDIINADAIATENDVELYYILSTYFSTTPAAIELQISTTVEAIDLNDSTTLEAIELIDSTTIEAIELSDSTTLEAIGLSVSTTTEAIELSDTTTKAAVELIIKTGSKEEKFSAKDYKTLIKNFFDKYVEDKKIKVKKIKEKYGIESQVFEKYLDLGFNHYEVENAYKLAKGDEKLANEILIEKQNGADWKDLISKHSEKKVKEENVNEGDGE